MPSSSWMAPLAALCGAALAMVLTPWLLHSLATTDSPWYRRRVHVWLAAVGGFGAALLGQTWVQLVTFLILAVGLALVITVDGAEERIPDRVTLPLYGVLFTGLAIDCWVGGTGWGQFARAVVGAVAMLVLFLVLALLGPLYLGDVKLAGLLGGVLAWFGWAQLLLGVFAGFLLHALLGIGLMLAGRATGKSEIAFGPSMVAGAALGLALGPLMLLGPIW